MERKSWETIFIEMALLFSERSPCGRLHVGCVLVNEENRVISTGYNGFMSGASHVSVVRDDHEQATVHAEMNCLTFCAKEGTPVGGCCAYITHYPCLNCMKALYQSGVKSIVYRDDYKNDPLVEKLFVPLGVTIKKF